MDLKLIGVMHHLTAHMEITIFIYIIIYIYIHYYSYIYIYVYVGQPEAMPNARNQFAICHGIKAE